MHMIGKNFSGADTNKHMMRVVTAAWALNIIYGVSILVYKILSKVLMKRKHAKVFDEVNVTTFEHQAGKHGKGTSNLDGSTRSGALIFNGCKEIPAADTTPKIEIGNESEPNQENENEDTFRKKHCVSPEESLRSD